MKRNAWIGVVIFGALLSGSAAQAHHSNTMFDSSREVKVEGTVFEYQWTNPHVFVEIMVAGASGPQKFIIEGPTPGVLRAHGWKFNSLKAGDKVVAAVRPLRDGGSGGYLVHLWKDGAPLGDGETSSVTIQGNK